MYSDGLRIDVFTAKTHHSFGLNGAISGLNKFNRYVGENNVQGVIRLVTIYSISCYILMCFDA